MHNAYTVEQFNADLSEPYAWPGGYPRFFITNDGAALSFKAAREEAEQIREAIASNSNDGWRVVACDVNWEDMHLHCAHTDEPIECAYPHEDEPADVAHWDRFDICEAYACLESDYNVGGMLQERASNIRRNMSCGFQLARMKFKARPNLSRATLSENGRAIYELARRRLNLPE